MRTRLQSQRTIPNLLVLSLALYGCGTASPGRSGAALVLPTGSDAETSETAGTPQIIDPAPEACPIPPASPNLPALADSRTWASDLSGYLNQGGLLTALIDGLRQRPLIQGFASTGKIADLDSNGYQDLALTILEDSTQGIAAGSLLIFLCQEDHFELSYLSPPGENQTLPEIAAVRDLNADGVTDLLLSSHICGAHSCFIELQLFSWDRSRFANILDGRSDDLPNPTLTLEGPDPDGTWRISLTGTGISSAGAGPYRERTRTWSWDAAAATFIAAPDLLQPPRYRIHMLHDADLAAASGDMVSASQDYARVIEDGTLDDWIGGESSRRSLAAFAAFRQMWLHLWQGETREASAVLEFLQASATNDSADVLEMARITFETYQLEGIEAACSAAQAFAAAHQQGVLEPLNFGYANRSFNLPDICLNPD